MMAICLIANHNGLIICGKIIFNSKINFIESIKLLFHLNFKKKHLRQPDIPIGGILKNS